MVDTLAENYLADVEPVNVAQRQAEKNQSRPVARFPRKPTSATKTSMPTASRYVPQSVKDAVVLRDNGRCSFETATGQRCGATTCLHFNHRVPFAKGGRSDSAENVRLLCAAHNKLAAIDEFGFEFMERFEPSNLQRHL